MSHVYRCKLCCFCHYLTIYLHTALRTQRNPTCICARPRRERQSLDFSLSTFMTIRLIFRFHFTQAKKVFHFSLRVPIAMSAYFCCYFLIRIPSRSSATSNNHHHFAGKQADSARHYPHPVAAGREVEMTDAAMGPRPRNTLFTSETAVQV